MAMMVDSSSTTVKQMEGLLKRHGAWKVRNAAHALHLSEQEEMIDVSRNSLPGCL